MKKARIAINGFGRIGRLFLRQSWDNPAMEVVAINDLGDLENLAYLLRHDTVYRDFNKEVRVDMEKHCLVVEGREIAVLKEKDPTKLPWGVMDIDITMECTGLFESFEGVRAHITAGAKRAVISAPGKDEEKEDAKTILMGVNDSDISKCIVTSNGSCTTNATSPVVTVLSEEIGIAKAMLSTIHAYTATQALVDGPVKGGKDFRRGRAAAQNIVPSSTGAAVSVARAIPAISGKFDGLALRVPTVTGSLSDITMLMKRPVTKEEVNDILRKAASSERWKGILAVSDDQLVSSDVITYPAASIVDASCTKVVDGDLLKVLAWYDNEYGYVITLLKHVEKMVASL
jgi:glyceraldehyde 3-phosphate dehydrogenase